MTIGDILAGIGRTLLSIVIHILAGVGVLALVLIAVYGLSLLATAIMWLF